MRLIIIIFLVTLYSCSQQERKTIYIVNPTAKKLNDSADYLITHTNQYERAVSLLKEATKIDSNYFDAYFNKYYCESGLLHKFKDALETAQNLSRLRPENPEYYYDIGFLSFKVGDTILGFASYKKALNYYDKMSDTMSKNTPGYVVLQLKRSLALTYIRKKDQANIILTQLYNDERDEGFKNSIATFIKKTREQILDSSTSIK